MHTIRRSALVEHSATRMFDLVNDVAAYPRRFDWCSAAELIEQHIIGVCRTLYAHLPNAEITEV